jgi:CHAD domain-containing protein
MRKLVSSQTAHRLKKLGTELRRVAGKPKDADAIHDLRVAIRRLSQELRVFEAWFEPDRAKRIRRNLRKLMERCAAVRNCDVAIEVLRAAGFRNRAVIAGLDQERRHMREALDRKLADWRRRDRVRKFRKDLRVRLQKAGEGEDPQGQLPAMIDDLFRAGREAALPASSRQKMHRFRLKTKRMRYTLELFEPIYGEKTTPIMETLKELQGKLGAINDCATTLEMIGRNRTAAAAVQELAGKRVGEFREYWKVHFKPREKVRWKAVLGAADGNK